MSDDEGQKPEDGPEEEDFASMLEHAPVQLYYVVPFTAATMP